MTSAAVLLAAALVAATGAPPQEQVTVGSVRAALFYTKQTNPPPTQFKNLWLQIARGGAVVLDQAVPPYSRQSAIVMPAGVGQKRSLSIHDLDGDGEPEVLLDLFWGGAHCCSWTRVYRYDASGNTYVPVNHFWGDLGYRLQDLDGDGKPELISGDDRFAYRFAAFAFSGFPIQIWSYAGGRFTDVTRRFPKRVAADAARQWRYSREAGRRYHEYRGFLASWAADQYLLGHRAKVAQALAGASKRGELNRGLPASPAAYIRSLERFLRSSGYG
jgi:hypothetical protein